MALSSMIRELFNRFGLDLRRNPYADPFRLQRRLITRDDPVVFDIGAYIGLTYATYRKIWPRATIHAFEPFPDSHARLCAAIGNDVALGHAHRLALSDHEGSATLHANVAPATNSLLPAQPGADQIWRGGVLDRVGQVSVHTTTLDDFCRQHDITRIDVLKMDVQGMEYRVLKGAHDLLSTRRIGLIYLEVIVAATYDGQYPLQDYLALLGSHGYELLDFFNPIRRDGRLLQMDAMFSLPGHAVEP